MPATIDRTAAATALAKVIAYRSCGKHADADAWLDRLAAMLANPTNPTA